MISVIGAGGIGAWVVTLLKLSGTNKEIVVYDFDVVKDHNLERWLYSLKDVGKLKIKVLQERYPDIRIVGVKIAKHNLPLLSDSQFIIAVCDDPKVKRMLEKYAKKHKKRFVFAGANKTNYCVGSHIPPVFGKEDEKAQYDWIKPLTLIRAATDVVGMLQEYDGRELPDVYVSGSGFNRSVITGGGQSG
jgi:homoserine dehydrogenase